MTPRLKRVLITGSSGLLGRHLLKIAPKGFQILAQYNSHKPQKFAKYIQFLQADFLHRNWQKRFPRRFDAIIHTAALANLDECEQYPDKAYEINVQATLELMEVARAHGARFIFLSSDVVFDGQKGDYSENDTPNPINIYS